MTVESRVPFESMLENPPYRFQWVLERLKDGPRMDVLDYGCNYGVLLNLLGRAGFTAFGIDIAKDIVEEAEFNAPEATVSVGNVDCHINYPDATFEAVTCLECLEHVKDMPKLLSEMIRVCKPGGKVLITTPVGNNYDCPEHLRHFDFYGLCEALEPLNKEFTIQRIFKTGKDSDKDRCLYAIEVTA
jgi:2-polyprenyl-3-methyl-5-hydroxy-6-metoxy-1,4-benzoquinol methylase